MSTSDAFFSLSCWDLFVGGFTGKPWKPPICFFESVCVLFRQSLLLVDVSLVTKTNSLNTGFSLVFIIYQRHPMIESF